MKWWETAFALVMPTALLGILWLAFYHAGPAEQYLYVAVEMPADAELQYRDEQGLWQNGAAPGWQIVEESVYVWSAPLESCEIPRPLFDRVKMRQEKAGNVQVKHYWIKVAQGKAADVGWRNKNTQRAFARKGQR